MTTVVPGFGVATCAVFAVVRLLSFSGRFVSHAMWLCVRSCQLLGPRSVASPLVCCSWLFHVVCRCSRQCGHPSVGYIVPEEWAVIPFETGAWHFAELRSGHRLRTMSSDTSASLFARVVAPAPVLLVSFESSRFLWGDREFLYIFPKARLPRSERMCSGEIFLKGGSSNASQVTEHDKTGFTPRAHAPSPDKVLALRNGSRDGVSAPG
jgi:hypothetical protein